MCGIAGLIDYKNRFNPKEVIDSMVASLAHRGPDGEGTFVRNGVALGHRRLSIIDLEGGRQPMATEDGNIQLTFNGEIYNYKTLQRELESKGHRFRTHSDTEVVLQGYREWGKRCVDRFEGMFAFAVADFDKNEVFLARDPFGIKPLLYRKDSGSFAFASEIQALRQLPDWTGEIDLCAIDLYLRYQYVPAPQTAFRKVFKLPAGHCMTVRIGEPYQKIERYWEPDFSRKQRLSPSEWEKAVDDALRESVRRHLVADVPFGALLSGGVDSSLVVGYMSEILNSPVKTFSIGFDDESVNELDFAREVSTKYGTEHHEEIVHFDAIQMLPEIVRHHGEPFGDQSAIPTWAVSKLARTEVPMVLSGDGGDELLGGYGTYGAWLRKMEYYRGPQPRNWKSKVRPLINAVLPSRYAGQGDLHANAQYWTECFTHFAPDERAHLWRPELRFVSDRPCDQFVRAYGIAERFKDVNRVQFCDLETYLPEDILCKVDIASMRYGLEVRPPMLDRQFFATVRSMAPKSLYRREDNGESYCGKLPLKNLAAGKLGVNFAFRPKQGFCLPLDAWLRRNENNFAAVRDRLLQSNAGIAQWFESSAIESALHRGRPERIWMLLVLEEWCCQQRDSTPANEHQTKHSNFAHG